MALSQNVKLVWRYFGNEIYFLSQQLQRFGRGKYLGLRTAGK